MIPRVVKARHVRDYVLELAFSDGTMGQVDFRDEVMGKGGIFRPLEDVDYFRQMRVDEEIGTLVWPNEVDFCPEVLYSLVMGKPMATAQENRAAG